MDTAAIDRAAEQFRTVEKGLYRGDGQPRYGPEEHAERRAALFSVFDSACEAADVAANKAIGAAERALFAVEHADPVDRLHADDLARASAKATFIKEDCEALPLGDLAARCAVALASGDAATRYVYARYARRRGEKVLADLRNGTPMNDDDRAALGALDRVLTQLDATLADPDAARKRERAEATIKAARAAKMHIAAVHNDVSGAQERTLQRMRATYGL